MLRLKNPKPSKAGTQSARLQFKRPRSSTGSAKDADSGHGVAPPKMNRVMSARGAPKVAVHIPTEGILKKKDLERQLSELDLEIERERSELIRMSQ